MTSEAEDGDNTAVASSKNNSQGPIIIFILFILVGTIGTIMVQINLLEEALTLILIGVIWYADAKAKQVFKLGSDTVFVDLSFASLVYATSSFILTYVQYSNNLGSSDLGPDGTTFLFILIVMLTGIWFANLYSISQKIQVIDFDANRGKYMWPSAFYGISSLISILLFQVMELI